MKEYHLEPEEVMDSLVYISEKAPKDWNSAIQARNIATCRRENTLSLAT
jgi:hypothetical protein